MKLSLFVSYLQFLFVCAVYYQNRSINIYFVRNGEEYYEPTNIGDVHRMFRRLEVNCWDIMRGHYFFYKNTRKFSVLQEKTNIFDNWVNVAPRLCRDRALRIRWGGERLEKNLRRSSGQRWFQSGAGPTCCKKLILHTSLVSTSRVWWNCSNTSA